MIVSRILSWYDLVFCKASDCIVSSLSLFFKTYFLLAIVFQANQDLAELQERAFSTFFPADARDVEIPFEWNDQIQKKIDYPQLLERGRENMWENVRGTLQPFDLVLFGDSGVVSGAIKLVQLEMEDDFNTVVMEYSHIGYFYLQLLNVLSFARKSAYCN